MSSSPINIFFSYASSADEDKQLFDALRKHLTALKWLGYIAELYDSAISAGSDWRQVIDAYLNKADIIVLLFSADFLDSYHCREVEMKRALELYEVGTARVIYVLLRPVDWSGLPLNNPIFLPPGGDAVSLWPNRDSAFVEVVKGIRKVVDELTNRVVNTFALGPKRFLWSVPYRRNLFFTGREEFLGVLHTYFSSGYARQNRIQALNGLAGIGKTEIAIEYAYRYQQEYQAVFWIRASSLDIFYADALALADLLALPEKDRVNEARLFTSIQRYLQSHEGWLLCFDDLDDFHLVEKLVPPQCSGHVLLTTRIQIKRTSIHAHALSSMTMDEGALFLLRRAGLISRQEFLDTARPEDHFHALAVVQEFDGFPLALDQAGAYIEETEGNLAHYLTLYHQHRARLLQQRVQISDSHPQSVTMTLLLAFEQVVQVHPVAMELLYLFAFLYSDAIPDEMIVQGAVALDEPLYTLVLNPLELDVTIAALVRFSLVHRRADTTTLNIHRMVQVVLRDSRSLDQRKYWAMIAIRLVNAVFPRDGFPSWSLYQRYLAQAQYCIAYVKEFDLVELAAAQLSKRLGDYCSKRALYDEAETYLTLAVDLYERLSGPESLDVAGALASLALLYYLLGDYSQSEAFYVRALGLYEQIPTTEYQTMAILWNDLALLYLDQGRYGESESLYQRVLTLYTQISGPQHVGVTTTLNNLALLYQKQGRYQESEKLYLKVLKQREAILQAGHPDFAQSWNNLATLYQDQGRYEEAKPFLQQALALFEQTMGSEHPDTAMSINNLALLFSELGDYEQAQDLHLRALAIYEQIFGTEHPDIALTLNNIGKIYFILDDNFQAEAFYRRAIDLYERVLGPEHPDIALSLNNLGKLYLHQGRILEAEPLLLRAIAIAERSLGPEHLNTLWYVSNLAQFYTLRGEYHSAEALYQHAFTAYLQNLGRDHPETVDILERYALLYELTSRPEAADALRQTGSSMPAREKKSPPNQAL
jgi:tetratricopeptide (TPR) repeat protein